MKRLSFILGGILMLVCGNVFSQVTVNQSDNITQAMELKKEVAKTESAFQIQIYNGNIAGANETLTKAKDLLKQYPALLTFETPNYKVRIGSFRTQIEAEKHLIEIKKVYPAAFVMSPKK